MGNGETKREDDKMDIQFRNVCLKGLGNKRHNADEIFALTLAKHPRLGNNSPARGLVEDNLQHIFLYTHDKRILAVWSIDKETSLLQIHSLTLEQFPKIKLEYSHKIDMEKIQNTCAKHWLVENVLYQTHIWMTKDGPMYCAHFTCGCAIFFHPNGDFVIQNVRNVLLFEHGRLVMDMDITDSIIPSHKETIQYFQYGFGARISIYHIYNKQGAFIMPHSPTPTDIVSQEDGIFFPSKEGEDGDLIVRISNRFRGTPPLPTERNCAYGICAYGNCNCFAPSSVDDDCTHLEDGGCAQQKVRCVCIDEYYLTEETNKQFFYWMRDYQHSIRGFWNYFFLYGCNDSKSVSLFYVDTTKRVASRVMEIIADLYRTHITYQSGQVVMVADTIHIYSETSWKPCSIAVFALDEQTNSVKHYVIDCFRGDHASPHTNTVIVSHDIIFVYHGRVADDDDYIDACELNHINSTGWHSLMSVYHMDKETQSCLYLGMINIPKLSTRNKLTHVAAF
jgi:hypothetical protein